MAVALGLCGMVLLVVAFLIFSFRTAFYVSDKQKEKEIHGLPKSASYDSFRQGIEAMESEFSAASCEEIYIRSEDGKRLFGRYYENTPGAPIHIAFHGYRSTAIHDHGGAFRMCRASGHNLLIVDQRAHGKSDGHVIGFGVPESRDVVSWVSYVSHRFGKETPLFLQGISMGAATVLCAASLPFDGNVIGVLADCPFATTRGILEKVAKDMGYPVRISYIFLRLGARLFGRFDPEERTALSEIQKTTLPVLLIHGEEDGFVPYAMSRELFAACAGEKKNFVSFPGADHGMSYLSDPARYEAAVRAFEDECLCSVNSYH